MFSTLGKLYIAVFVSVAALVVLSVVALAQVSPRCFEWGC